MNNTAEISSLPTNATSKILATDGMTPEMLQTVSNVTVVLNVLSICASSLLICSYVYFRIYYREKVDRVSLRLAVSIAAADILFSIFQIIGVVTDMNGLACRISTWGYILSSNLTTFLTVMVAINLQLVYLHRRFASRRHASGEYWFYIISFFMSTLLASIGLIAGKYGRTPTDDDCWFVDEGTLKGLQYQFALMFAWVIGAVVYSLIIVSIIILVLQREKHRLKDTSLESKGTDATQERKEWLRRRVSVLVRRIMLYPLVPLFSQTANIVLEVQLYLTKHTPAILFQLSFYTTSVQGLLNVVAYCLDPDVQDALNLLRRDLLYWYLYCRYVQAHNVDIGAWTRFRINVIRLVYPESERRAQKMLQDNPIQQNDDWHDEEMLCKTTRIYTKEDTQTDGTIIYDDITGVFGRSGLAMGDRDSFEIAMRML